MTFTDKDLQQFVASNISPEKVDKQIENFKNGFPYMPIVRAATIDDGILQFNESMINQLIESYQLEQKEVRVIKFVPASGAASRMFKSLFAYLNAQNPSIDDHPNVGEFMDRLEDFAFYEQLKRQLSKDGLSIEALKNGGEFQTILDYVLTDKGLNYGYLPKGLITFHRYGESNRLAVEEHMIEGIHYGIGKNKKVTLHFTVSPEHLTLFESAINKARERFDDYDFDISFSTQLSSTNTIAVDLNNEPFRESDGSILFRPAGHGALISNLNALEAEVIFIKNIDNVVPDKIKSKTYVYKRALAGLLLSIRETIAIYMDKLNDGHRGGELIKEVKDFIQEQLNYKFPEDFDDLVNDQKFIALRNILNRPTRICGMVKNEGEPGGGPFWVKNSDGSVALQIVETSQINLKDPAQKAIVDQATHFNPVDLICSTVDHHGNKFDLLDFVDPTTGFITEKSKDGKKLKAQELPGLWNGAMANWNTIFVEVPVITFNPVKTVNDLLRPQHQ